MDLSCCDCRQTSSAEGKDVGWLKYELAWVGFLVTHSLPWRPPIRPWLQARLGKRDFTISYSVLSLAALAWLIGAAGRAPGR